MLAAAVVFAHSVSPHHHHVDQEIAEVKDHSHDDDHDHHHAQDHHRSEEHSHNIFTFSQIDEAFFTVKYVFNSIDLVPFIVPFEWSTTHNLLREPEEFFIQDSERPPLIRWCAISFRGPPTV